METDAGRAVMKTPATALTTFVGGEERGDEVAPTTINK